jgi:outer membrane protein assembly factor BamB
MCPEGSAPQVVAYEFDGDGVEWVSCTDEVGYWSLLPVADGVVHVATFNLGAPSTVIALDATTGEPIEDAPAAPRPRGTVEGQPYTGQPARVEVGDITIVGGQDDAIRAYSSDGKLWSQAGYWAYDNVWAIDDGAVFAVEEYSRLAAYEVETGEVRWSYEGDPYREGLWPFYAVDERVYTLWSNLQVRSTADGELLWLTDYPAEEMEDTGLRMSGVDTDGTDVFVSFATEASPGD